MGLRRCFRLSEESTFHRIHVPQHICLGSAGAFCFFPSVRRSPMAVGPVAFPELLLHPAQPATSRKRGWSWRYRGTHWSIR